MKKLYNNLKALCTAVTLLCAANSANAQCAVTFTPTYNANGNVSFAATATPTGAVSYYWQYYSGSSYVNAGPSTSYNYNNGTYTVSLFAIFGTSVAPTCSTVASAVITVTNSPCPAGFNANYTYTVGSGNNVNFTSTSTGTTTSTTFTYNFGDGGSANIANPSHTYPGPGNYQASLIINDGMCMDSVWYTINIPTPCALNASFTSTVGANGIVNVTSTSTGTIGGTYYSWSWGDSSPNTQGFNITTAGHNYALNGGYVIILTASNSSVSPTCTSVASQTINVTTSCSQSLNAQFNSTLVGSAGQVNFASTSTGTVATTQYAWNYGDGSTGTGVTSSHTYANGGMHNVKLTLTDASAPCYDSIMQWVNVTNVPCVANSNFTLAFSGTPQLWYASPAYFGNVQAAQWSWGDGQFSNQLFTSHTYSTAGMYNICLTVTTSCGTSSTCVNQNIFKTTSAANANNAMVTINVVPQMVTGINANVAENALVSLYPNPNSGSFKVNVENVYSENVTISVYNILGEKVYSTTAKAVNGNVKSEVATNLANGTYYIQVKSDAKSYNLKTVISK